ncbi:MAG: hypothetical protein AAGA03_00270 [Planctomycetota bacterium]
MPPPIPSRDGETNAYDLFQSGAVHPRIYFVNGIRVRGKDHALTAGLLSLLVERTIWGVYNQTAGLRMGTLVDLTQCGLDYAQNVAARLSSHRNGGVHRAIKDHEVPEILDRLFRNSIVWNKATATLVRQLVTHRKSAQRIIAHSQGNLIASNALFVVEGLLGASALRNIRVYSLASPAPAWPLGIRKINGGGGRQENAFMNDIVALLRPHNLAAKLGVNRFQNEGDFRIHPGSGAVSITPHKTKLNIALNFFKSIRNDLGLSADLPDEFLERCAEKAQRAFAIS